MCVLVEREALRDSIAHRDDAWETQAVAAAHALGLPERRLGNQARAVRVFEDAVIVKTVMHRWEPMP